MADIADRRFCTLAFATLAREAQPCAYHHNEICYWISTRLNPSPDAPIFSPTIRRGDPEMHSDDLIPMILGDIFAVGKRVI